MSEWRRLLTVIRWLIVIWLLRLALRAAPKPMDDLCAMCMTRTLLVVRNLLNKV